MKEIKNNPVYEMPAQEYNTKLAGLLKEMPEFKQPEWSFFVKTGTAKVKPPQDEDFWYKRAASILRQIYTHKVVGVNRLKTRYGSLKNRGMQPEHFKKGSGKMIRVILQQAEKAGLLEKYNERGKRAGRILTEKGKEFLEGVK
jgi:small subunit ribosomal protein S19e